MANGQQNQTTAIAKNDPLSQMTLFLRTREKNIAAYAASRLKPDTLIKLALLEFSQNADLRACRPESVYASLISAAQLGLEPGRLKGEGYLVPYRGECQFITGYRGLIKLALRSKGVKDFYAHVVHMNDGFRLQLGTDPRVDHEPTIDGDPGEIRGVYAVAHLATGGVDVEWMNLSALEKIRNASPGRNSDAYRNHLEEMFRKAPLRRLAKRLPLGDDFYAAAAVDEAIEAGSAVPRMDMSTGAPMGDVTDADVVEQPSSLASKVAKAAQADEPPKQ